MSFGRMKALFMSFRSRNCQLEFMFVCQWSVMVVFVITSVHAHLCTHSLRRRLDLWFEKQIDFSRMLSRIFVERLLPKHVQRETNNRMLFSQLWLSHWRHRFQIRYNFPFFDNKKRCCFIVKHITLWKLLLRSQTNV